ncbi:excalibur calcium-binding domain-containing protein [Synechococcus sp.]|uniref:excalibur calcium-binding domain-containing protein n=1 Tax=Synechococcus sp. TaxID=1131 RepID=UPI0034A45F33
MPGGIQRPWDYRRGRKSGSGSNNPSSSSQAELQRRRYRCKQIGSWAKAQELLKQGHTYLDGDGDGEACEGLR